MKMNRRRFFQSALSLAVLAFLNPLKLIPRSENAQPKDIKISEAPFDLITLHNLQPQHRYSIRAGHGPVKIACLDHPITLQPGQAVVITPKEDGGWTQIA